MSYINAEEVLPQELIETIQRYVNGKAIYIPSVGKHSWNLTVYERTKPRKIPQILYELFLCNDEETAQTYGNDVDFLKRNNAELKYH